MTYATRYMQWWEELREFARETHRGGRRLIDDALVRDRLAQVYSDVLLMRLTNLRYLTQYERGAPPGLESSYMKLLWVAANQGVADLAMLLMGREGLLTSASDRAVAGGKWTYEFFYSRAV